MFRLALSAIVAKVTVIILYCLINYGNYAFAFVIALNVLLTYLKCQNRQLMTEN